MPIDDNLIRWHLAEVVRQANLAHAAAERLNDAFANPLAEGLRERVFAEAHAVLTAGAQISKIADPGGLKDWDGARKQFARARGRGIRAVVKLGPLLKDRNTRNSVEHFDRVLDDVLFANPDASFMDGNVAAKSMLDVPGISMLRNYDPSTHEYSVLEHSVELPALLKEMREARDRAQQWLAAHPRW